MTSAAPKEAIVDASPPPPIEDPTEDPWPTYEDVRHRLFMDRSGDIAECPPTLAGEARVLCLYDLRYRGDAKARALAVELYTKWKIVAGVEPAHTMDGGYRGMIELVPAAPINADRKHIEWIVSAMRDFDRFFDEIGKHGDAGGKTYRFHPMSIGFMRSPKARTPSAYASTERGWVIGWNLAGSLHRTEDAVRETLFHEIFHLNDQVRGAPGWWSTGALSASFDAVVKRCGTSIPCLGPYTPNGTIVVGGTYYSFQPGNGVVEYAAELALRYYREQRAAMRGLPREKPFKCGPQENRASWAAMRDEFFGGIDVVPACP